MDRGELVSDEIMGGVVDERLDSDDTHNRGYILDGFPRTVGQAELLAQDHRSTEPLDLVIDLVVPVEVVLERLAGPPGVHRLRAPTTPSTARPATAGCATTAAARSCSGPTTPPRPSRSASTSTSARRRR